MQTNTGAIVAALEQEQQTLNAAVASPGFYKESAKTITQTLARIEAIDKELLDALARWDALESIAK